MVSLMLLLFFLAFGMLVAGIFIGPDEERPTLKWQEANAANKSTTGLAPSLIRKKPGTLSGLATMTAVLRPLVGPDMRRQMLRDLEIGRWDITPETFVFYRIVTIVLLTVLFLRLFPADLLILALLLAVVVGWMFPSFVLTGKINRTKTEFVKQLPDMVDLLGLCVGAGLDFMMALKWVVEKSPHNVVAHEMDNLLQDISVGKPRRDALRDMAKKYELTDLSTFSRTLIQADKMGTSVSEALTILSEDMRLARFRRGEAIAMKAPLKMLVPLLFFIFPVVGILVGGPILLEFMGNNPMSKMGSP
ncbi:MAG: type II secretion system F family protein [Candidatus Omnitrophica bacterium]|nr:type II secretion system F family protein [Candidatus Omnitrophota bacterium]